MMQEDIEFNPQMAQPQMAAFPRGLFHTFLAALLIFLKIPYCLTPGSTRPPGLPTIFSSGAKDPMPCCLCEFVIISPKF